VCLWKGPRGDLLEGRVAPQLVITLHTANARRGADGKFDNRRSTAILLPHITDLANYHRCFNRYLSAPYKNLSADGLGDAALSAMLELKADDDLDTLGVDGCTVVTMGTVTTDPTGAS
jgi:hypothetical protein